MCLCQNFNGNLRAPFAQATQFLSGSNQFHGRVGQKTLFLSSDITIYVQAGDFLFRDTDP